jgi:hypothetical protein
MGQGVFMNAAGNIFELSINPVKIYYIFFPTRLFVLIQGIQNSSPKAKLTDFSQNALGNSTWL